MEKIKHSVEEIKQSVQVIKKIMKKKKYQEITKLKMVTKTNQPVEEIKQCIMNQ